MTLTVNFSQILNALTNDLNKTYIVTHQQMQYKMPNDDYNYNVGVLASLRNTCQIIQDYTKAALELENGNAKPLFDLLQGLNLIPANTHIQTVAPVTTEEAVAAAQEVANAASNSSAVDTPVDASAGYDAPVATEVSAESEPVAAPEIPVTVTTPSGMSNFFQQHAA